MNFSGQKYATVDEKGRVLLPADYKNEMGGKIPGDQLVIQRDPYEKCLNIYTTDVWNADFARVRAKLNRDNREHRRLLDMLYSNFKVIQVPDNGRMNLPNEFLEKAGIKKDVIFTGLGDCVRLWDVDVHKAYEGDDDYGDLYGKHVGSLQE